MFFFFSFAVYCVSRIFGLVFYQIWKNTSHDLFQYYSVSFLYCFLLIFHRLLILDPIILPFFCLSASVWIISISPASDLLILSFSVSNLLLCSSKEDIHLIYCNFFSGIFIWSFLSVSIAFPYAIYVYI